MMPRFLHTPLVGLALCLAVVLVVPGPADAGPPLTPVNLKESMSPAIEVSGKVLVGVLRDDATSALRDGELNLEVELPARHEPPPRMLCVRIISRDGRYKASFEVILTAADPGRHTIPIKTSHATALQEQIAKLGRVYLAPMVALADDCDAKITETVAARWLGAPDSVEGSRVILLINSGRLDTIVRARGVEDPITCEPIEGEQLVAFDKSCTIAFAGTEPPALTIERRNFGNIMRVPIPAVR